MSVENNNVRITVLVENTATPELAAEHGLSCWIETTRGCILFDTGQGSALPQNADRLRIPLEKADAIVLSHGHYDHTGGLPYALGRAPHARLFLHPASLSARYSRHKDGTVHAIGMPEKATAAVRDIRQQVVWTTQSTSIIPGCFVTGTLPRRNDLEDTGGDFFFDEAGTRTDPIEDDQALWFETRQGLIVVLGCAHSGVINTLGRIAELSGRAELYAVIGGMHLGRASTARIEATAQAFERYNVQVVAPAHCTGPAATEFLKQELPGRVRDARAGSVFEFK